MRGVGMLAVALGAGLGAGCTSDREYIDVARAEYGRAVAPRSGCEECAVFRGAAIVRTAIHDDCANSCKRVEFGTEGPAGRGRCTFMVSRYNGEWHVQGGCGPSS